MAKKRKRGRPRKNFFYKKWGQDSRIKRLSHIIPILTLPLSAMLRWYFDIPWYAPNALFGGVLPFIIIMGFVYMFVYAFLDFKDLTNNVRANKFLAPFVFLIIFIYSYFHLGLLFLDYDSPYLGALGYSTLFTFIYMYSSEYFQPDLDHHSRPGTSHFPLGKWIAYWRWGRFLKWMAQPINKAWNLFWTPYATLFTHRGVAHWPILSVYLRVAYIWVLFLPLTVFFPNNWVNYWVHLFIPWSVVFNNMDFVLWCLPVFMSDFVHIAVDYIDSVKRGMPFCSDRIPRGLIANIIQEIKNNKN